MRRGPEFGTTAKLKFAFGASILQKGEEFGSEDDTEGFDMKEEIRSRGNPARLIEGQISQ